MNRLKTVTTLFVLFCGLNVNAGQRATTSVAGETLQFFPEVLTLLNDFATNSVPENHARPDLRCPAHAEAWAAFPQLATSDSWLCSDAKQAYKMLFKTSTLCLEIADPLGFLTILPVKEVETLQMGNLDEVVRLFAPVLLKMDGSGPLLKKSRIDLLSSAALKLRIDPIRERIQNRRAALVTVNKNLIKNTRCLRAAPEEVQRAINLFGQAFQELSELEQRLNSIEQAGLREAQNDAAQVAAAGRRRDPLPYPSMTDLERRTLSFTLSSLLWRARGGGIFLEPEGTNQRRLAFTLMPMREIARLNGGDRAAELGTLLALGLLEPWGRFHDMGRIDGDKWSDYASMKTRGDSLMQHVVGSLEALGYRSTAAREAGPMLGHCYWYGAEKLAHVNIGLNMTERPFSPVVGDPANWGEICMGGSAGIAFSEDLLAGY